MPFGSVFGAIVFGGLGVMLGSRMIVSPAAPLRVMGACLVVLGIAVGLGLLMKRSWARWLGVFAGIWFAGSAAITFLAEGGVFHLTVVLAAAAAAVLLVIPATGRPVRDPALGPPPPSVASRALMTSACLALVGFLGATAWALARRPAAPEVSPVEAKNTEATKEDARPAAPQGPVTWRDFADGLKQAKQDRKLVVADFYATWCGPCKYMEKRTFRDARVMTRLRDVVPVRVDAEETTERGGLKGADLALRYGVDVYPTIVVVDGNGREIARNSGAMEPDEFLDWLDSVIEKANTTIARS